MENNLEKIYAYQEMKQKGGGESICHSAILRCEYGSQECVLNLPKSHGKYIGSNPQIDEKDGKGAYFGYCRMLGGVCQAVQSDWFNVNRYDLMFDDRTLKMEGSVQKNTGFMVCSAKEYAIITAGTSGQTMNANGWKCFPEKKIFRSIRRPGRCIEVDKDTGEVTIIKTQGDIHTNDTEDKEFLEYHPYFKYQLSEDADTLFKEFYTLGQDFTIRSKEMRVVVKDMIDHFRYKKGKIYSNDTLKKNIRNNKETMRYRDFVVDILKYELIKAKGDLSKLDIKELDLYMQSEARYPNYEKNDMFTGLFVAIHAMWANDITIKSYKIKGDTYWGLISIKFYDHFGLGSEDAKNKKKRFGLLIPDLAGIRAWYVLQHWTKFEGKYKPFINTSTVEYMFEGDLRDKDKKYYDLEEIIKNIKDKKKK